VNQRLNLSEQKCINLSERYSARFLLAVKLYELGKISSGKAAKLAGLRRVNFLLKLSEYKVSPFQVSMNEILEEAGR